MVSAWKINTLYFIKKQAIWLKNFLQQINEPMLLHISTQTTHTHTRTHVRLFTIVLISITIWFCLVCCPLCDVEIARARKIEESTIDVEQEKMPEEKDFTKYTTIKTTAYHTPHRQTQIVHNEKNEQVRKCSRSTSMTEQP